MRPQPRRVLRNARLILPDRCVLGDLVIEAGRVAGLTAAGQGTGDEIWDLDGRTVTPGLIDLHTHGGWGIDFATDSLERLLEAPPRFAAAGVTRLLITLVPAPIDELCERLAIAAEACERSPGFVGIHLEGPFLAARRRGALPEAGIQVYDAWLCARLLEAAAGHLRILTFAPEAVPPAEIGRLQATGLTLSIGHTDADAATTEAAIRAGARRATHLCNAMPPLHHRAPGAVLPLLLDERVRVEVIADGEHLDDRMLELILRLKGHDRVQAVSDAMPLAGLGPASGHFAGSEVLSDGRAARRADGTLAGSVQPLLPALLRTGQALGLELPRLLRLGSTVPAQDLPLSGLGRIATGAPADLVILDAEHRVVATLRAGRRADVAEPDGTFLPQELHRVR